MFCHSVRMINKHTMESVYCVNCGSADGSMLLEDEQILHCVRQWTAPLLVQAHDLICTTCWTRAQKKTNTSVTSNVGRNCALCIRMLAPRSRSHQLISLRTETQQNIRNILIERLTPLEIRASHYICHPCWQRCDRAAGHYSAPSSSRDTPTTSNQSRCAICGIHFNRQKRHILHDDAILVQIQQLVAPQIVTATDYICEACHTLFVKRDTTTSQDLKDVPMVGHQHICVVCGCSLARIQRHSVQAETNSHILDVVRNWVQPREIQPSDLLCNKCFQRANTAAKDIVPVSGINPVSQHTERITLPNYSRASDTHNRCIFLQCNSSSQRVVPFALRVRLLKDHKYYIPPGCRLCELHLARQSWSELFDVENVNRSFTAAHIEDFCELLKNDNSTLDLENIEQMDDHLVWYWLGHTKEQFRELEEELPDFQKRATSLGAYLMKLRTGDSDERISSLLKIGRSTLSRLVAKAREVFVPAAYLGLQQPIKEEVTARNLYSPDASIKLEKE